MAIALKSFSRSEACSTPFASALTNASELSLLLAPFPQANPLRLAKFCSNEKSWLSPTRRLAISGRIPDARLILRCAPPEVLTYVLSPRRRFHCPKSMPAGLPPDKQPPAFPSHSPLLPSYPILHVARCAAIDGSPLVGHPFWPQTKRPSTPRHFPNHIAQLPF